MRRLKSLLCNCLILLTLMPLAMGSLPLIVDTDMDTDDAIALNYLLHNPKVDIKAILVDGNGTATCEDGLQNAAFLLKQAGKANIPLACGVSKGFSGSHRLDPTIRARDHQFYHLYDNLPTPTIPQYSAKQLLLNTLRKSPEKITVLTIGSLTTIAEALLSNADLLHQKIKRLYILGGALQVPGNVSVEFPGKVSRADINFYFDPLATRIVLSSGLPITLIPLDATNQVPLTLDYYTELKNKAAETHNPNLQTIVNILSIELPYIQKNQYFFWDPLAAIIATHPEVADCPTQYIKVLIKPRTLAGSLMTSQSGQPIAVCLTVRKEVVYPLLLQ